MLKHRVAISAFFLSLSACTTAVESNPSRTASEQMLISAAADRAASHLELRIPRGATVFLDNTYFEGTDSKYAMGAIQAQLLEKGARLVDTKKDAQIIVSTRAGALSTDQKTFLIGIPQFNVPIPFASAPLTFPQLALYSSNEQMGVAKFAAVSYDAKKGSLIANSKPQYGVSHNIGRSVLLFSWKENDVVPKEDASSNNKEGVSISPPNPVGASATTAAPAAAPATAAVPAL